MPFPIFCIEGPDCAGKSTLGKDLAKRLNAKYMHATYRFKGRMPLYHLAYFRQAIKYAQHQPVIMDRWYPSEYAYGNVFRSGSECDKYWRYLARLALRYHVVQIWCVPRRVDVYMDFLKKNYHNNKQMYPDMKTMASVWQQYRDWTVQYHYNFHHHLNYVYDATTPFSSNDLFLRYMIDSVKAFFSQMPAERKKLIWSDCLDYTGNIFNPGALIRMPERTSRLWDFNTTLDDAFGLGHNEQIYGWFNRSDHPDAKTVLKIAMDNAESQGNLIIDSDDKARLDRIAGIEPVRETPIQGSFF